MSSVALDDAVSLSASMPWSWQPSKAAWFHNVRILAENFDVPPELDIDVVALRTALRGAAEAEAEWLFHPAISPLFRAPAATNRQAADRALHLAIWVAAHVPADLGYATIPDGFRLWTPQGSVETDSGRCALAWLGSAMRTDPGAPAIGIDLFDTLLGSDPSSADGEPERLPYHNGDIVYEYLATIHFLQRNLPSIFAWTGNVARLVVPYGRPSSLNEFRSASDPEIAGLIRMDLGCGLLLTLEALVHESAHNYLYLVEAEGPIVSPDQAHRHFLSPLKPDPRPLRGVILAYHALAYIAVLYDTLAETDAIADRAAFAQQYAELWNAARDAEGTCMAARQFMTERGRQFLNDTSNRVFRYARRP